MFLFFAWSCAASPREQMLERAPRLFMRTVGRGSPVIIIIHGGPGSASDYLRSLETLSDHGYTIVTWDQRGVARSDTPVNNAFALSDYVADLHRVVTASSQQPVVLVGHSWGGLVAMAYTLSAPEWVAGLVLMDSAAPSWEERERSNRAIHEAAAALSPPPVPEGLAESCRPWWPNFVSFYADSSKLRVEDLPSSCHPDVLEKTWRSLAGYSLLEDLVYIRAPTLVVYGDHDPLAPMSVLIGQRVPKARIQELSNCGHRPMAECRDQLDRALLPFLGDLEGPW